MNGMCDIHFVQAQNQGGTVVGMYSDTSICHAVFIAIIQMTMKIFRFARELRPQGQNRVTMDAAT